MDNDDQYLIVMENSETTRIVTAKSALDGGMVEFYDAITGKFTGSCGIHFWQDNAVVFDPLGNQDLPPWPLVKR